MLERQSRTLAESLKEAALVCTAAGKYMYIYITVYIFIFV